MDCVTIFMDDIPFSPRPQHRSYFEVLDDNQMAHELLLRPVKWPRRPIAFKSITKYLKCTIPTPSGVKSADYDILLGISTKSMHLDAVEAIVITIFHNIGGFPAGKSEVITSEELRRLCLDAGNSEATNAASDDKCFRWKLHEKLILLTQKEEEKKEDNSTMIVMEVKTRLGETADYGSIELHYVEIIADLKALDKVDPLYREHKPFIHTADINRTGCSQLDGTADEPMSITDYSISGNGSCVLITAVAGDNRFLQLWNFGSEPQLIAWMQLIVNKAAYDYCLSWDGSRLACIDLSGLGGGWYGGRYKKKAEYATAFYKVDIGHATAPDKAIASSGFVSFAPDEKNCPKLKGLSARAAFHLLDTQNIECEWFVTCDGATIEVYSTIGSWHHVQSIALDPSRTAPINVCNALRNNLRSCYLAMRDRDTHQVSTWDINQGIRLSSSTNLTYDQMENVNDCAAMSKDGSRIAIPGKYKVDIFLTARWTLVVNYPFQDREHNPSVRSVQFLYNEEIMVALHNQKMPFHRQNRGLVLGANRVSMVEEYITEGRDTFRTTFHTPTSPPVICIGVSQVSLFKLDDRTVLSPRGGKKRCDESCRSVMSFLSAGLSEPTAPSGLSFKAEYSTAAVDIHGRHEDLPVLVVTFKDGNDQRRLSISLPKVLGFKSASFVNGGSHLLISFNELVMVWSAPSSPQDTFTLQLVHAVPSPLEWKVCSHRQLYGIRSKDLTVTDGTNLNDPIFSMEDNFMDGITQLPLIFSNSNHVVQQEIIHYIGKNVNTSHCDVVRHVCSKWMEDTHISIVQLWKAVLAHPIGRWIPKPDMVRKTNPLLRILNQTKDSLEAFKLAEVFIDYCVNQFEHKNDLAFLLPALQCLQELVYLRKPYSDTALKLLRVLTYLPVRDREAITIRCWVAHPFKLHWRFWRPNPGGLDPFKDQVLHVTSAPTVNYPEKSFSRDIYLAPLDMLWLRSNGDLNLLWMTGYAESAVRGIFFTGRKIVLDPRIDISNDRHIRWIEVIFRVLRIVCGFICFTMCAVAFFIVFVFCYLLKAGIAMTMRRFGIPLFSTVECHHFELEALDNPAIAALVEYKWNTIGRQYWLLRFLAQCAYYALVLVGIFMQIYSYNDEPTMRSIFTAIAAIAGWFLWLELMQIIKYKHGYFRSVYNYVDLLAYVTPFVASVLQLNSSDLSAQNSPLSFSALFIFLHFLFEMRVIRSVCKFVSIIIHAISSIRVFFFIFAGGILAFAIAITHLLHKCTDATTCSSYTESFSFNLFRAVSTTYFLMSGRYDPVSNGLSNNDVPIHVMLMMFFFFTVIIMMNVLIALINHAIDDCDKTWELDWLQNRMRFVEGAENMCYDLSGGFWDRDKYVPHTIYYTTTAHQIRKYKKTKPKEENPPTDGVTVDARRAFSDGNAGDSKAMMEMFQQLQKEQMETLREQQAAHKALLDALEEEKKELRKELARTAAVVEKFVEKAGLN